MDLAMLMLLGLAGFCVVVAAKPKAVWWATTSWKFNDPAANEPSDEAYLLQRIGAALGVVLFVGVFMAMLLDR